MGRKTGPVGLDSAATEEHQLKHAVPTSLYPRILITLSTLIMGMGTGVTIAVPMAMIAVPTDLHYS